LRRTRCGRDSGLPDEAIRLTTYEQLDLYLSKFAAGDLGLVLLLGRPGVGKSEAVRRWLGAGVTDTGATDAAGGQADDGVLYVEGHVQPFGLYRGLWEHRDRPVVLDDVDKLYADPNCVRLLKPLCNTVAEKRITWLSRATADGGDVPAAFVTRSRLVLLANEWRTLNANVRALEDRAIVLHFDPPNAEVHRQVGRWFADPEVYAFVERVLPAAGPVSMRHYCKASQLRRAGLPHWRRDLLQMLLADPHLACVAAVQVETGLTSERERVDRFVAETGASRATYFRAKARLAGLPR
jgi:hypothetical protein